MVRRRCCTVKELKSWEEADIHRAAVGEAVGQAVGRDTGRSHYMVPGREDIET